MAPKAITDYAEIQQLEIEALKAIYMDDFREEEAKTVAWNKRADNSFQIKLWPQSGTPSSELYATISVSLPATYPKTLPHLQLHCADSVPSRLAEKLQIDVQQKAKSLLGDESIHEVALLIQENLDTAATLVANSKSLPALDEERAQHEAENLEAAAAAKTIEIEKQELERQKLEQTRSASIIQALAHQQKSKSTKMDLAISFDGIQLADGNTESAAISFDQEMSVRTSANDNVVAFRCISDLNYHRQGPTTSVYTARPYVAKETRQLNHHDVDHCLPLLVMKGCELGLGWDETLLKAEISRRLETNLQTAQALPPHRNVLPLLGFRIQSASEAGPARLWSVRTLVEFMPRGSLAETLEVCNRFEADAFRTLMIQILEGLQHLHIHNAPHGRLTLDNILVERRSNGSTTLKISDYLYQADLHFLKRLPFKRSVDFVADPWQPPEGVNVDEPPNVAHDMWQLGIIASQLLFGLDVQQRHASPHALLHEKGLTPSLEQMLLRIFHERPAKRLTCFELLASAFLRSDESIFEDTSQYAISQTPSNTSMHPSRASRARNGSTIRSTSGLSRFAQDFSEYATLGKGGFGKVIRARNKLDGQWYAIKTIVSASSYELQSVLSEVMVLSRLSHAHVVRYITAWLEDTPRSDSAAAACSESDSDDSQSDDYGTTTRDGSLLSIQQPISSSQGLDFIESGANLQFGADSDEDDDGESELEVDLNDDHLVEFGDMHETQSPPKTPDKPRGRLTPRRCSSVATKTTLYIQMEYCENQTLRTLITNGLALRSDSYWSILWQIASALQYVHSQGIIHRDLKPENVFVTQGGANVRLGDFGLAKPQAKATHKGPSRQITTQLTASIGTSVYIAPEVRSSGGGSYNEKADMYSLGIMLFEMCHTLSATAMERAQIMENLRREKPVVPIEFEQSNKALERKLIAELIVHEPNERLSATALLEKIPTDTDTNTEDMLRQIDHIASDRKDPRHGRLIAHLFNNPFNVMDAQSFTYDLDVAKEGIDPALSHFHKLIKGRLMNVFECHGAVEDDAGHIFVPASGLSSEAMKIMAMDGAILQLPYDLILFRARRLAKQQTIVPCKTFTFNSVFRRNGAAHPRSFAVVDFDIISKSANRLAWQEAECMKVIDEIIEVMPALSSKSIVFLVNHSDVLNAILKACNIPESLFLPAKVQLSKLGGEKTASQVQSELRAPEIGISATSVDDLFRFAFKTRLGEGIPKLRKLLGSNSSVDPAFRHLETLLGLAKAFGIQREIYLDPLSCCNAEFYDGNVMFQCISETRRRAVICAGGRYDRLIKAHALSRNSQPCHAVGFSMSLHGVMNAMNKYRANLLRTQLRRPDEPSESGWLSRRCDVLVDSPDDSMLENVGPPILKELWASGIRAEPSRDRDLASGSGFKHNDYPEHEPTLMIKADGTLRLQGQTRREGIEVRRTELIATLRNELRERDRLSHSKPLERPRLRHETSDLQNRDTEVSVLWSTSRSKKSNRQSIVDRAVLRTAEDARQHTEAPIIAVELKDEIFESLRDTRLSDAESWKKVSQNAEPGSRRYIGEIYDLLASKAAVDMKGLRSAYLYNFRSEACILYDLSKAI